MSYSRIFFAVTLLVREGAAYHAPAAGGRMGAHAAVSRVGSAARITAGLFDGVRDAFQTVAPQDGDRITPIDRWLGIDKDVRKTTMVKTFIDPQNVINYRTLSIAKPMGIKFVENEDGRGIYVEMIVSTGSAAAAGVDVKAGDQLVSVDGALVLGLDFDSALGMITGSADQTVKLTVFRGAQQFLYGPTRPPDDWLRSNNF
jgi:hypothetical protein